MPFPIEPPIEPMLAKLAEELPAGGFLYEPKWDGFRAIVFRGTSGRSDVYIQSRDLRPLDRYFPELRETLPTAIVTFTSAFCPTVSCTVLRALWNP